MTRIKLTTKLMEQQTLQIKLYDVRDEWKKSFLMTLFTLMVLMIPSPYLKAQIHQIEEFKELEWQMAPSIGKVSDKAEYKIANPYIFLGSKSTSKFLELNGNLPKEGAYTIASKNGFWFGVLQFVEEGYVKDNEQINPDDLLETLKTNNRIMNEERAKQGMPALELVDWYFPPRYDAETKRLEWGTKLRNAGSDSLTVNVTTKILGRSGYTSAILVSNPETLESDLRSFKQALKNFEYISGEKYSEWKEGDRVAAYGLGALVLGGAAAVATKKGGFKLILLAIVAAGAALWAGAKNLLGRRRK